MSVLQAARVELEATGVRCGALHVSHGFHSPLVQAAADAVEAYAQNIVVGSAAVPMCAPAITHALASIFTYARVSLVVAIQQ
jgi:acyl transferase domain-containing protein